MKIQAFLCILALPGAVAIIFAVGSVLLALRGELWGPIAYAVGAAVLTRVDIEGGKHSGA